MNIEHNVNTQELTEEDYTKVYAGYGHSVLLGEDLMNIMPEVPNPPSGHKVDI